MKTIEEKAQAYDEALKVAKDIRNGEATYIPNGTPVIDAIFPELKESEDGGIKEELILYLKGISFTTIECAEQVRNWIAWLEKQWSEPNWCHHNVDLSNCSEEYRKAYYDGWNNCNMQHSQCESEKSDVLKCLINGMKFYYEDNKEATWGTEKFSMKVKDILSWLEKQGEQELLVTNVEKNIHPIVVKKTGVGRCAIAHEQKPALNVGPKFKKGEWLVENHHPNNYARFLQILEIYNFNGKTNYVVSRDMHNDEDVAESEFIETHWHPFNIKDAKDGDVLASKDAVFIFKHKDKTGLSICRSYCEVIGNSKLGFGFDFSINGVYPATKEQRDTLEKAMADAGYTFDFEKKEMKKIINQI